MYPNERYTKTGKFLEEKKPDHSTMCNCECHNPGCSMMHCVPCCDYSEQKRLVTEPKQNESVPKHLHQD